MVGFAIVASSILIFLPVILSKDVIVKNDPNAVVINQNGAVLTDEGKLTYQSSANFEQALNIHGNNAELALNATNNNRAPDAFESAKGQSSTTIPNAVHSDNSVEMLEFSRPSAPAEPEILTSTKVPAPAQTHSEPKPQTKPSFEPEILTAKPSTSKPTAPAKEVEVLVSKKEPAKAPAKSTAASNEDKLIIAGTKPKERFVVQVGVFSQKSNALNNVNKLKKAGISVYATKVPDGREYYRVYGGRSNNKQDLVPLVEKINKICGTKSAIVAL